MASSAGATVLRGDPVRVAIEGHLERAVGLRPHGGQWQLTLQTKALRQPLTRAEIVDETSRAHEKWVLTVDDDTLRFDAERFVPTHSYRVSLYSYSTLVERGVIYLYGDRATRRARVDFTTHDLSADAAPAELGVQPKGTL